MQQISLDGDSLRVGAAVRQRVAELGGVVAGVGQRVLSGVAKYLVGRFFKALEKYIAEARAKEKAR